VVDKFPISRKRQLTQEEKHQQHFRNTNIDTNIDTNIRNTNIDTNIDTKTPKSAHSQHKI